MVKAGSPIRGDGKTAIDKEIISQKEGYNNRMYFPHTESFLGCPGYWLSSPGGYSGCTWRIVYNGYVSSDIYSGEYNAIRPVVCLPSSVQLTETAEGSNLYTISNKTANGQ